MGNWAFRVKHHADGRSKRAGASPKDVTSHPPTETIKYISRMRIRRRVYHARRTSLAIANVVNPTNTACRVFP